MFKNEQIRFLEGIIRYVCDNSLQLNISEFFDDRINRTIS